MTKTPFTQELLQQVYEDNGLVTPICANQREGAEGL